MNKKLDCFFPYKDILFDVPRDKVKWCCKMVEGTPLGEFDPKTYYNDPKLNEIRQDLNKGKQHSACRICWSSENKNIKSWRQVEGVIPNDLQDKDLDSDPYKKQFYRFELFFDNTCDLACIYCGPWLSSKWVQENHTTKMFGTYKGVEKSSDEKIDKIIETIRQVGKNNVTKRRVDLAFLGGEPFLSPQVKDGKFKRFIDAYYEFADPSSELLVNFITNCNTPDKTFDKNLEVLKDCKQKYPNMIVHISMSLEAIGAMTESTRYGSEWNQVDKNIKKWLEQDWINFNFNTAFNALTIIDGKNYVNYLVDLYKQYGRKISVSSNIVYEPEFMTPSVLPQSFAPFLQQAIDTANLNQECFTDTRLVETFEDIKNNLGKHVKDKEKLAGIIRYMIEKRNIDVKNIMPEVYNYLIS